MSISGHKLVNLRVVDERSWFQYGADLGVKRPMYLKVKGASRRRHVVIGVYDTRQDQPASFVIYAK